LAASPGRPGNQIRRRILRRSRSLPWSQAERRFHEILDRHGITGWVANHAVRVGDADYLPDVAFRSRHLACEIDGYEHHSSRLAFTADRRRQNDLTVAGWTVLRFSWEMLNDEAAVVAAVRAALGPRTRIRAPGAG
jgi:very-short-patch-repair endonuclease